MLIKLLLVDWIWEERVDNPVDINPARALILTSKLFCRVEELLPTEVDSVEMPSCKVLMLKEMSVEKVELEELILSLISEKFT